MKRAAVAAAALLFLFCSAGLPAYEVDTEELTGTENADVRFENYVGPHSKIESIEQIRGIGTFLGRRIASGMTTASYFSKYEIIHAVDPSTEAGPGLDADIFSILRTAEVDHVRSIRWMLDGYISTAYGYSRTDSELLARFVTLYNAVHRNDLRYFSGAYKPAVAGLLRDGSAGLSSSYTEWAGGTQILIPLTDGILNSSGKLPDSSALTDEKVVEELRKQDDKGIDLRKDMVDLKERELEQAQDQLAGERDRLSDEKQQIAEAQKETVEKLREVEAVKPIVLAKPASPQKDAELAELKTAEERLRRQAAELETRAQDVDESLARLDGKENALEQRREDIRSDREEIAADQKTIVRAQETSPDAAEAPPVQTAAAGRADAAAADSASAVPAVSSSERLRPGESVPVASVLLGRDEAVYFIQKVGHGSGSAGRLVMIDPASGSVSRSSALNSIRGRLFGYFDGKILVIAGREDRGGAVRMHLLAPDTLDTLSVGSDDIYPESAVRITGSSFLAVSGNGESWKLGKFGTDLKLLASSAEEVEPDTFLTVTGERVYLQAKDGRLLSLALSDLSAGGK